MPTKTTNPIALYHSMGEARAASRLVREILARGFTISVNDGEETTLTASRDKRAIMREMGTTGENILTIKTPDGKRAGWFLLVYGNDPSEIVCDHGANETCEAIWQAWDAAITTTAI